MLRLAMVLLVGCGSKSPGGTDATASIDATATDALNPDATDAQVDAAIVIDAVTPDALVPIDAFPAVLPVRINCRNDCVLVADPPAINVAAGTRFEVDWINTGDTECDVAKVDQFNQVSIIIGLEPGTSYHDSVRQWCGSFTGTFQFRVSICAIHSYVPVSCGG